jgi:tRNA U34 5-methylaminomethyl-2-thiouridine-forming methyltransferase MnmC
MLNLECVLTTDGSRTLFVPDLKEHYHSVNGAFSESMHVFIKNGFRAVSSDPVKILEIGFGTGLNAYLTLIESLNAKRMTIYHGLELFPLPDDVLALLHYTVPADLDGQWFQAIHKTEWERDVQLNESFILKKIQDDLLKIKFDTQYDLVYFDAFAPDVQPDLWAKEIFQKIYQSTIRGGILTTYCAKGAVRRIMSDVGFQVERLPGAPGKREMLRAVKS